MSMLLPEGRERSDERDPQRSGLMRARRVRFSPWSTLNMVHQQQFYQNGLRKKNCSRLPFPFGVHQASVFLFLPFDRIHVCVQTCGFCRVFLRGRAKGAVPARDFPRELRRELPRVVRAVQGNRSFSFSLPQHRKRSATCSFSDDVSYGLRDLLR